MIKKLVNQAYDLYIKAYNKITPPTPYYNYYYSTTVPKNITSILNMT